MCPSGSKLQVPTVAVTLSDGARVITGRRQMRVSLAQLFACESTHSYLLKQNALGSGPTTTEMVPRITSDIMLAQSRIGNDDLAYFRVEPEETELVLLRKGAYPYSMHYRKMPFEDIALDYDETIYLNPVI